MVPNAILSLPQIPKAADPWDHKESLVVTSHILHSGKDMQHEHPHKTGKADMGTSQSIGQSTKLSQCQQPYKASVDTGPDGRAPRISPSPSMGARMKQSQASWRPLPLNTWSLNATASSSSSAAAYPLPQVTSTAPVTLPASDMGAHSPYPYP